MIVPDCHPFFLKSRQSGLSFKRVRQSAGWKICRAYNIGAVNIRTSNIGIKVCREF